MMGKVAKEKRGKMETLCVCVRVYILMRVCHVGEISSEGERKIRERKIGEEFSCWNDQVVLLRFFSVD